MKLRTGFVSNSSSSSFIIAVKNDETNKWLDIDKIFGTINKKYVTNTHIVLKDEILINHLPGFTKNYDDCISKANEFLNNGYHVYQLEIDRTDDTIKALIHYMRTDKNIIFIMEERE